MTRNELARPLDEEVDGDEEKARSGWIGTLAHRLIADLVAEPAVGVVSGPALDPAPSRRDLARALLGRHRVENRAHLQTLLSAADSYFRYLLPPAPWHLLASEQPLPPGRVDLVWTRRDGAVLIDEVKTGGFDVRSAATRDQCRRYAEAAAARYGPSFVGVRVVSVRDPPASWVLRPDGHVEPLAGSGLLACDPHPRRLRLEPIPGPSGRPVR